jgi:hypothetical protein
MSLSANQMKDVLFQAIASDVNYADTANSLGIVGSPVVGAIGATYTQTNTIIINGVTVTLSTGTTVANAVTDITGVAAIADMGIVADSSGGALRLTRTAAAGRPWTYIRLQEGNGTALAQLFPTQVAAAVGTVLTSAQVSSDWEQSLVAVLAAIESSVSLSQAGDGTDANFNKAREQRQMIRKLLHRAADEIGAPDKNASDLSTRVAAIRNAGLKVIGRFNRSSGL